MAQQLSLQQIIQYFAGIAADHKQINGFYYGPKWDYEENKAATYPMMVVIPQVSKLRKDSIVLRHKIQIIDQIQQDATNRDNILSDSLQTLMDIKAFIWKDFFYDIFPTDESDLEPVYEVYDDLLGGWSMDVELQLDWLAEVCSIPGLYPSGVTFQGTSEFFSVNLANYLPLTGGQLTGALSGTCVYMDCYYSGGTPLETVIFNIASEFSGGTGSGGFTGWTGSTGVDSIRANNGTGTLASGDHAVAEGYNTTASGPNSHSEGFNSTAGGASSHAEGYSVALGTFSHAEGHNTLASGDDAHSEGTSTIASGNTSHAEGQATNAFGSFSHSEGFSTTALGQSSHSEGNSTLANSPNSHAEGQGTTALGDTSHSEGASSVTGIMGYLGDTIVNGVLTIDASYGIISSWFNIGDTLYIDDSNFDNSFSNGIIILTAFTFNGTNMVINFNDPTGHFNTADGFYVGTIIHAGPVVNPNPNPPNIIFGAYTAHAEGENSTALGEASHAEGIQTLASGLYSHAEGNATTASAISTHSEGQSTTANGTYSHAEGFTTQANGNFGSHAEGYQSIAAGQISHAEGNSTLASGNTTHAEGQGTTAIGDTSHAEGISSIAFGDVSHAEGNSTTTIGQYSHSEGNLTTAIGNFGSHAEGSSTTAVGTSSHSEGTNTKSIGVASHAEGGSTTASGNYSHAGGILSIASGYSSFIHSTGSTVSGDRSVVLGGHDMNGVSADTVYVPFLNIASATTNNSLTNLLVSDSNGYTHYRTVSSILSGATDIFTTGLTFNNITYILTGTRNDGVSYSANLAILASDITITGGTYNASTGVATFTNNSGGTFQVSGFTTGLTDTAIASYTYNNANKFTITDTTGGTFSVIANVFTGLTATTISATTYQNLPIDIRVTGGTYNSNTGIATYTNNIGGTFNVSGFYTNANDIFVTGGTSNNSTKTYTFTNTTGGTFNVIGLTDIYTTGITNNNNLITLTNSTGGTVSTLFNTVTGFTVNGLMSATTASATTLGVKSAIVYTDGNQASGKILTSDASGNATWQFPSTNSILTYMFTNLSSDVSLDKQMVSLSLYSASTLATTATTVTTSPTILGIFATNSGFPNITVIPIGVFNCHYETQKAAGANNYYTYYEVYKRNTLGVETLISTSDNSTQTSVNTIVQNTVSSTVLSAITLSSSDRLVVKIYGVMISASASISLLYDDTTLSRFELPSATVDATNFVPYTGATNNINLNNKTLSNVLSLSSGTVSATTYNNIPSSISATFDGQGGVISTGTTAYITMTNSGTFNGWYMTSPLSGFATVDVWKASGTIPTSANSIAGTNLPILTNQSINSSTNVNTWTSTTFAQGDVIGLSITSASTITYLNVSLKTTKQ